MACESCTDLRAVVVEQRDQITHLTIRCDQLRADRLTALREADRVRLLLRETSYKLTKERAA